MGKPVVYLKGAYGPGNLGDDVLMLALINILSEVVGCDSIVVGVERPSVAKRLNEDVKWVDWKRPYVADLFLYGGGGQFFTFTKNSEVKETLFLNKIRSFISNNRNITHALVRLLFSLLGASEKLVLSKRVASYCIGMGPFEEQGYGASRARKFLEKADYISFRDKKSLSLAKEIFSSFEGVVYSDPTFNDGDWRSGGSIVSPTGGYAFIVREWPYTDSGEMLVQEMLDSAVRMKTLGYDVFMVVLDAIKDSGVVEKNKELEWLVYDPSVSNSNDFLNKLLSSCKYIISCRAHGVWLPSILGVPVLAAAIEPKLKKVHDSLPCSSLLYDPESSSSLDDSICDYVERYDQLKGALKDDIIAGKESAMRAKYDFKEWFENAF